MAVSAPADPERLRHLIGYDFGGPYLGFYDGDNPHRTFEPESDDPKQRSNTEIDARYNSMEMLQLGNITPAPTLEREGERVASLTGAPPDLHSRRPQQRGTEP